MYIIVYTDLTNDVKPQKHKVMNNFSFRPSVGQKLFVWASAILLSIAFVVVELQGHIDWSLWWVLSPLWIAASFFLILRALNNRTVSNAKKTIEGQVKSTFDDIVKLIQETNEDNVQEKAKALYEKMKWIDRNQDAVKIAIPDQSTKLFTLLKVQNGRHKLTCQGIGDTVLSPARKKSAVEELKSFEEDYLFF